MKLIKLHLSYLFNKVTIILLSISLIIYLTLLLYFSKFWINGFERQMFHNFYLNEYISNVETIYNIIVFVSIMIFNNTFNKQEDSYVIIVITRGITKFKYFIYKIIALIIVISLLNLTMLALLILISKISSYYISLKFYNLMFIEAIIYGLISLTITQFIKSNMVNIIIVIIYWINELVISMSVNIKYLQIFIPHVLKNKNMFYYGIDYAIIYIVLIILLNIYVYINTEVD